VRPAAHPAQGARVIFTVEGALDELGARLLACSVALVPSSAVPIIATMRSFA